MGRIDLVFVAWIAFVLLVIFLLRKGKRKREGGDPVDLGKIGGGDGRVRWESSSSMATNPATGLPMTGGAVDVSGRPWGSGD